MLDQLRKDSEGKLIICFTGVGSAFAKRNYNTSAIIAKDGKVVLIDCGATTPLALHEKGISVTDFDGYYFTHGHADHVGGVEELLFKSRYVTKTKPTILITEEFQDELWEKTLRGGLGYADGKVMTFADYADFHRPEPHYPSNREFHSASFMGIDLTIFRTKHIETPYSGKRFWSSGLLIERMVVYSGDTVFDVELFNDTATKVAGRMAHIFHDCQLFSPGAVHATFDELKMLPEHIRNRMYLMHYGDNWESFHPENFGFKGFARPWRNYVFPLLPSAARI